MNAQDILLAYGRRLLGEPLTPIAWHSGHAGTVVLRAGCASHPSVIVKIHRGEVRHAQEVRAYQDWLPQLGDDVPRLVEFGDDPPGIAITTIPGVALADCHLSVADEQAAYAAAGALLTKLHAAAPEIHDPQFPGWLAERGRQWLHRAGDRISTADRRSAQRKLDELAAVTPPPLVPCHLDLTPRNLIRDTDGTIRLIDFEHSRHDLAARDLVRLTTRVWHQRPDLEEAFRSTYGAATDEQRHLIECCAAIDYASGLATGTPTATVV